MTKEEHIKRHLELHKSLDELTADLITQTKRNLTDTTIMELMEWSYQQTINPTEEKLRRFL